MRAILYITCLAFLVLGCSKSSVDDDGLGGGNPGDIGYEGTANGVKLFFPQENSLCNLGTNITPTESTVYFEWQANSSGNYKVVIENLTTGNIIQQETNDDIIPIVLQRATPYSWYVESSSGSKKEHSATWQFYNAGPGVQSYAPFPAVIESPNMAQSLSTTTNVDLKWTGSDVDDDIVGYDIYFGTNEEPNIFATALTLNTLNVTVASNVIYYWKIITIDALGNTSDSGTYQFVVL